MWRSLRDFNKSGFSLAQLIGDLLIKIAAFCIFTAITLVFQHATCRAARYDIGAPVLRTMFVDGNGGDDSRTGESELTALRTVSEAWRRIPQDGELVQGFQILLLPGDYNSEHLPNYWENRIGTAASPIVIRSAYADRPAVFRRDINLFNVRYLYLLNFQIVPDPAGDTFHCEQCDHVLLRGMTFNGMGAGVRAAHETIKINQSQHIYIEHSDIFGSYENSIDFVAVQYGHIIGNRIHDADDWCAYVKGGSAMIRIENNQIYNCGTGGFTAGQGTGFEFMTSPWLHYEAYDIKFINNLVWNTEGAGIGVNGGYNILLAHNTLFRVGTRSHAMEVVFGGRGCDGNTARCSTHLQMGGWGTSRVGEEEPIPNRNVYVFNNLLLNPAGVESRWSHFAIYGARQSSSDSNIPNPVRADDHILFRGNVIWNGSADLSLGIGDDSGCADTNTTCNAAQLRAENHINRFEPRLRAPDSQDFRPDMEGLAVAAEIPPFPGNDRQVRPLAPAGLLTNLIERDYAGTIRGDTRLVGALLPTSPLTPGDGVDLPPGGGGGVGGGNPGEVRLGTAIVSPTRLRAPGGRIAIVVTLQNYERVLDLTIEARSNLRRELLRFPLRARQGGIFSGVSRTFPANRDRRKRTATWAIVVRAVLDDGSVIRLPVRSITQSARR